MICARCGCVFCWDEADEGGGPKLYCSKVCQRKAEKRRRQAREAGQVAARRRHIEGSLAACIEKGKRQYPDCEMAQAAAAEIFGRTGQPLRAYRCAGTDHWHLTSLSSSHSRMIPVREASGPMVKG